MAPLIRSNRDDSRSDARKFKAHGLDCTPKRIKLTVTVEEID